MSDTKLPEAFIQSIKELLPDSYDALLRSYDEKPYLALRVNTLKISVEEFEKVAPYRIEKIPFTDGGYYINDTDAWSKHPYYYAGLYYIQEPSAMLPGQFLPVSNEHTVLDLCAAPGGKSFSLLQKSPQMLLANDISFSRTIALVKNIEMTGAGNCMVMCEKPEKLSEHYKESFDRIIVDAPCSGEGMFRKDPGLIKAYKEKGPDHYRPIQEEILNSAYSMLKNGGLLMYSTCTFSDIEDEQVILSFLSKHKDMSLCDIDKTDGLCGPYKKYDNNDILKGCVHALPHLFKGEGHFLALMKKNDSRNSPELKSATYDKSFICYDALPENVRDFFNDLSCDRLCNVKESRFITGNDGFIYMLGENAKGYHIKSIRYVRTGICVGSINRSGTFTPHTAFALSLEAKDHCRTLCFDPGDQNVIRYLKGETLVTGQISQQSFPEKGYVLVCVGKFPLGFAKSDGKKLKNLYEKGWVYK